VDLSLFADKVDFRDTRIGDLYLICVGQMLIRLY
jgi:hypothetical protein